MYNHIVMEPSAKIREIARNALKGKWKPMFIAMIIFYLLTDGIALIISKIFSYQGQQITGFYVDDFGQIQANIQEGTIEFAGNLYTLVVFGVFTFGLCTLLLTFFRAKTVNYSLLFEGFGNFGKAFVLELVIAIKVMLWSLLFVIPGIIAYYRYSQAFYIMVDNPNLTAMQCINESKRLMRGNKGKLFCLHLSLIGWSLLAGLAAGVLMQLTPNWILWTLVAELPVVFFRVYLNVSEATFYELVTEKLVVVPVNPYEQVEYQGQQYQQQGQGFQQNQGWQQAPANEEPSQAGEWHEQSANTQPDVDSEPPIVDVEYTECPAEGSAPTVEPAPSTDAGMGEQGTETDPTPTDEN